MVRVAILGSRGIPPRYGGFESVAWSLATYMPHREIQLYVFCESKLRPLNPSIVGVRTVYVPVFERIRIVSEVVYDIIGLIWCALRRDIKIVYLLGYGASPFCVIPRLFGKKMAISVDGLEWKRRKFGRFGRLALRILERIAHYTSNYKVFDSRAVQDFHEKTYGSHPSFFLPYCIFQYDFGTELRPYYLVVARLEPENNIDLIIKGFEMSGSKRQLWIVGDSGNNPYKKLVLSMRREKVRFLGPLYGEELRRTRKACFAYIHGHEVGGTNPSLLEAMSFGNVIMAMDTPFNREVAGKEALYYFNPQELASSIQRLEHDRALHDGIRRRIFEHARKYDCANIMEDYVRAFRTMQNS